MIVCKRCGKENQDHYKFCLGCGAELREGGGRDDSAGVGMMKTVMADTPSSPGQPAANLPGVGSTRPPAGNGSAANAGSSASAPRPASASVSPKPAVAAPAMSKPSPLASPAMGGAPMSAAPAGVGGRPPSAVGMPPVGPPPGVGGPSHAVPQVRAQAPQSSARACGQCGTDVPPNFRFCGGCGMDLNAAPAAAAPAARSAPAPSQPAPAPAYPGSLTLIRPDGSEGGEHNLRAGENRIGRNHGTLFENDGYLSPEHAIMTLTGSAATIRDLGSLNGVFVRMSAEEEVEPGQIIRIGQELLRFDRIEAPAPLEDGTEVMGSPNPGYWGKITVIIGKDTDGSAYPLLGDTVALGRERGDINFPDDGYVSGLHARMHFRNGRAYLTDMGSSNGTFLRVRDERPLGNDSFVLLGQQLFRLRLR